MTGDLMKLGSFFQRRRCLLLWTFPLLILSGEVQSDIISRKVEDFFKLRDVASFDEHERTTLYCMYKYLEDHNLKSLSQVFDYVLEVREGATIDIKLLPGTSEKDFTELLLTAGLKKVYQSDHNSVISHRFLSNNVSLHVVSENFPEINIHLDFYGPGKNPEKWDDWIWYGTGHFFLDYVGWDFVHTSANLIQKIDPQNSCGLKY